MQPAQRGTVLVKVPFALAITEHAADAESNQLLYEGAPGSVRLACKLLRQVKSGKSELAPYLASLPEQASARTLASTHAHPAHMHACVRGLSLAKFAAPASQPHRLCITPPCA